jgi:hypothetical protein
MHILSHPPLFYATTRPPTPQRTTKKYILRTWFCPKVPEIERANAYEYIEIPLGASPYTLLESVWQVMSSWVVGFIVGERIFHCCVLVSSWFCDD